LTDALQRYGPVVRVGSNCVIFRNIDTIRTIYATHRFRKSSWWTTLTIGGSQNMFSTECGGWVSLEDSPLLTHHFAVIPRVMRACVASVVLLFAERTSARLDTCLFKRWMTLLPAYVATAPMVVMSTSCSYSPSCHLTCSSVILPLIISSNLTLSPNQSWSRSFRCTL